MVIQQPNFFGVLEDVDALTDWAHARGILVIAVVNPTSLAILKAPGQWGAKGADIVVGDGQPLGVPLSSGGPYFGFMTTRMEYVRSMPGRIVGRTVDLEGRPGFTLTLQAREQHIRRGKATSNICTNQGLLMTAATIYLSLLGPVGLARVAEASHQRTQELVAAVTRIKGVRAAFDGPRFHEAVLLLDRPVAGVLARTRGAGDPRRLRPRRRLSRTRPGAAGLRHRDQDPRRPRALCRRARRGPQQVGARGLSRDTRSGAIDMPHRAEKVVFEFSREGRGAPAQWPAAPATPAADIPAALRRADTPLLPEISELEAVRHFTRLSQLNFSIDTHFYPLGSCTMKYNPKGCNQYAMLPRVPRPPSARARDARARASSPACTSCRKC